MNKNEKKNLVLHIKQCNISKCKVKIPALARDIVQQYIRYMCNCPPQNIKSILYTICTLIKVVIQRPRSTLSMYMQFRDSVEFLWPTNPSFLCLFGCFLGFFCFCCCFFVVIIFFLFFFLVLFFLVLQTNVLHVVCCLVHSLRVCCLR